MNVLRGETKSRAWYLHSSKRVRNSPCRNVLDVLDFKSCRRASISSLCATAVDVFESRPGSNQDSKKWHKIAQANSMMPSYRFSVSDVPPDCERIRLSPEKF